MKRSKMRLPLHCFFFVFCGFFFFFGIESVAFLDRNLLFMIYFLYCMITYAKCKSFVSLYMRNIGLLILSFFFGFGIKLTLA